MRLLVLAVSMYVILGCQKNSPPEAAVSVSEQPLSSWEQLSSVEGITEYKLSNGLRVLLFPDPSQATITVNITYFVGSRHEGSGEGGMAHLLEHMVFKGTPSRPDIWKLLQEKGASFNGTTWTDRTNYYETLPATTENLEFALALEADRMINSNISQEVLQKEFSVVRNEFEMGENRSHSVLLKRLQATAYLWHGYGKSTIGNRSDIEKVPAVKLKAFYKKYYQPDNAMVVVAGRFDPKKTIEKINQHFGVIPKPDRVLDKTYTIEPQQDGERFVTLRRKGDVPLAGVVYHIVPGSHADFVPLEALRDILVEQPTGHLYKSLVKKGWASSVDGYPFPFAEPGTFYAMAMVNGDKDPKIVLDRMVEVIEKGPAGKVTLPDIERFKNKSKNDFRRLFADSQKVAIQLSEWAAMGDWRLLFLYRDRTQELQAADVERVWKTYFVPSNRTAGLFIPTKTPVRSPLVVKPDVTKLVENYQGKKGMTAGEAFEPTFTNIASRTEEIEIVGGAKAFLLSKKNRGETVKVQVAIRYGNEKNILGWGAAEQMLPALTLRGTKNLTYQELRDRMIALDVTIEGRYVDRGLAQFTIATRREKLEESLKLFSQLIKSPRLDSAEYETIKNSVVNNAKNSLNQPRALAANAFARATYLFPRESPWYRPTLAENIKLLEKTQVNQLRRLHSSYWSLANSVVAIVGDFDREKVEKVLSKYFNQPQAAQSFAVIPLEHVPHQKGALTINTPDKKGAMVSYGFNLKLDRNNQDFAAAHLASYIFGFSSNSRLNERLRQKEGIAYGAWGGISIEGGQNFARFHAGSICAPENAQFALKLIKEEITKFSEIGISADELAEAKISYLEKTKNRLSKDAMIAYILVRNTQINQNIQFYQNLEKQIENLSLENTNRIIKNLFRSEGAVEIKAADHQKAAH